MQENVVSGRVLFTNHDESVEAPDSPPAELHPVYENSGLQIKDLESNESESKMEEAVNCSRRTSLNTKDRHLYESDII